MPIHTDTKILPYSPQQMFDLVSDVGAYPEFLPWCLGARIREQSDTHMLADLIVGYKVFREKFTSYVRFDRQRKVIHVEYLSGPLSRLNNHWVFKDAPGGSCEIEFLLDFELKSRTFQSMMDYFFHEALGRMVSAFETRAHALYVASETDVSDPDTTSDIL